jgi:hypothetical protein
LANYRLVKSKLALSPLTEIAVHWVDPITHQTVQAVLEKTIDNTDIHPYHQILNPIMK